MQIPPEIERAAQPSASVTAPSEALIRRIFPTAIIAFGLGLTAAWATFLGYELVQLLELAV